MEPITLDQIRVFLAVVEEGSFSGAARRLHRAQSAVSYAIANLERLLDVTLFERAGRTPELTDAGRALLSDARAVQVQADQLLARARRMAQGTEPRLSLAVDMMFPMELLLDGLGAFRQEFPDVSLMLHTEALGGAADLVDKGLCKIGISPDLPQLPEGLKRLRLLSLPLVPVAAPGHPLAQVGGRPTEELLKAHTQLVLTDRSQLTAGVELGVAGGETWRLADLSAKHACLLAGFGWGSMPLHLVEEDLAAGRLVHLNPDAEEPEVRVPLVLLYRTSEPPGRAGAWLVEHLLSRCQRVQNAA